MHEHKCPIEPCGANAGPEPSRLHTNARIHPKRGMWGNSATFGVEEMRTLQVHPLARIHDDTAPFWMDSWRVGAGPPLRRGV
jgi:hypothetical protein